jgi:thymidylate synthase (FAD)
MKVRVVSYSAPSQELLEHKIDDIQDLIAFCARVSNPSNQYNTETSEKLLNYLMKHKHWSVFEMANVCLEIETTRDIARQILRHRSMNFQEFSQRYGHAIENMDFVLREARLQDYKNRQNSISVEDEQLQKEWDEKQQGVIDKAREAYEWAISKGIAKEQARAVLPEGNTMSRMYVNGTLRSWIHYCELRCANGTQKEHMEVAKACAEVISKIFPLMSKISV